MAIRTIQLDGAKQLPTVTIQMGGLVRIFYDFRLFDTSGLIQAFEKSGVNRIEPRQTFILDPVPLTNLDGRLFEVIGTVTSLDGSDRPYSIDVTISQNGDDQIMPIDDAPAMQHGLAHYSAAVRFEVS